MNTNKRHQKPKSHKNKEGSTFNIMDIHGVQLSLCRYFYIVF